MSGPADEDFAFDIGSIGDDDGSDLLQQLEATPGTVAATLSVEAARASTIARMPLDEPTFRWQHNEDAMATEKLGEGIRSFAADTVKLEAAIAPRLR